MSVDYSLEGPDGETLRLDGRLEAEGGTYVVGGWDTCELNVTYNYGRAWHAAWERALPGAYPGMVGWLDGRLAASAMTEMLKLRDALGTDRSDDYWEPTEGNARHALDILISFAEQHPQGRWRASAALYWPLRT